jgi:hypothetical protein
VVVGDEPDRLAGLETRFHGGLRARMCRSIVDRRWPPVSAR